MTSVDASDPASFRDPSSRVFFRDGDVLRGLDDEAAADWKALNATSFFGRVVAEGKVVATEELDQTIDQWAAVLRHERIACVSYPYEWTFSMLQDAAVLQLELLLDALGEGMTMKDGYAYNVQWRGSRPAFIDIPSFERDPNGGPWAGYRQFCESFLNPLILQAHKDVPFRPWLRGAVNGVPPRHLRNLMSWRDLVRPGVLKHVVLHSAMESRFTTKARAVETELQQAGFTQELTRATVKSLLGLVRKLRPHGEGSHWVDYRQTCVYSDRDHTAKETFVREVAATSSPTLALDLGCNDGFFSRVVAETAGYVVAVDGDEGVVDNLYRSLRAEGNTTILPLVMDLADPSPGIGWRGRERRAFSERVEPDLVLALALLHHLVLSANVPLPEVVAWLRSFDADVIVEFVGRDDPMVEQLLANKRVGQHDDYHRAGFEEHLRRLFEIDRREVLPSGDRTLYLARPRP